MNKLSATEIPLSPEEAYEASQLIGKGLFGLTQLMQSKNKNNYDEEASLSIPIPIQAIANKTAEFEQEEGLLERVKQDPGKYVGTALGALLGAYIGDRRVRPTDTLYKTIAKPVKGALIGSVLGLGTGHLAEKGIADIVPNKHKAISSSDLEALNNVSTGGSFGKLGSENSYSDNGILSRLFKDQSSPLQSIMGAQQGFANARKDFYKKEKEKIDKQIRKAQQEYIDVLSKIKQGEEATPCVDAFCNGIAHSILSEKTAAEVPPIEEGSLKRVLGDAIGLFKKPVEPAIDTVAGGLLNTAASSAYLTYMLRKKMRQNPDKFMEEKVPTKVELIPYE